MDLNDTLYVPEPPCNLVSISKVTQISNDHVICTKDGAYTTSIPDAVLKAVRKIESVDHRLYRLELLPEKETAMWTVDLNSRMNKESATSLSIINNIDDM